MSDPFARPSGGNYVKFNDLDGLLCLFEPKAVAVVPGFGGEGTREEVTADVTIFGPNGVPEVRTGAKFNNAAFVDACKPMLQPGGKPMLLAVVGQVATKATKQAYPHLAEKSDNAAHRAALDAEREKWFRTQGKSGPEPKFAWVPLDYSDDQAEIARKYLATRIDPADPFAAPVDAPPA